MSTKSEKLLRAIGEIGEDLVQDAAPLEAMPKKRVRRWARGMIAAAAAAALLVGTAFAASPGLREMLAAALGGFAPYATDQGERSYVVNEFEYTVLSAVSDGTTLQVYVQQKDMVKDRLNTEKFIGMLSTEGSVAGSPPACMGRDESTGTSLWKLTTWGNMTGQMDEAVLLVSGYTEETWPEDEAVMGERIPLEIEPMPSKVIAEGVEVSGLPVVRAEEIKLSPLGLTIVTKRGLHRYDSNLTARIRVCMADGTEIEPESDTASGQGTFGSWDDPDSQSKVMVWNFSEPVDLDQVIGVYITRVYFPVE